MSTLRATSRRARSRNRSESWTDSQCGNDAMWRDRCDACFCLLPLGAKSAHGGAGDRDAARRLDQPENRSSADPGSHAKIRATERTTSQSYRRTPTSIATYSMSRNPEISSAVMTTCCELRAEARRTVVPHPSPMFDSAPSHARCSLMMRRLTARPWIQRLGRYPVQASAAIEMLA